MKKMILTVGTVLAMLAFNGCSGEGRYDSTSNVDYENYENTNLTTLFLVDEQGFAYADVPYKCDSMYTWSRTAPNGEFSFVEPDTCAFDFNGLDGVYGDGFDEIVRIVDYRDNGKGGIPYECSYFGVSSTYSDGSFEYDEDDACSFYL